MLERAGEGKLQACRLGYGNAAYDAARVALSPPTPVATYSFKQSSANYRCSRCAFLTPHAQE